MPRRKTHAPAPDTSGIRNSLEDTWGMRHICSCPHLIDPHRLRQTAVCPRTRQIQKEDRFFTCIRFFFHGFRFLCIPLAIFFSVFCFLTGRATRLQFMSLKLCTTIDTNTQIQILHHHFPPFHAHQKIPAPAIPTTAQHKISSQSAPLICCHPLREERREPDDCGACSGCTWRPRQASCQDRQP